MVNFEQRVTAYPVGLSSEVKLKITENLASNFSKRCPHQVIFFTEFLVITMVQSLKNSPWNTLHIFNEIKHVCFNVNQFVQAPLFNVVTFWRHTDTHMCFPTLGIGFFLKTFRGFNQDFL